MGNEGTNRHSHLHGGKSGMSHCCDTNKEEVKISKKLKILGGLFILVLVLSFLPALQPLNESLLSYLRIIWWAVLLGLFMGGVIEYFIPEDFIFKFLGKKKKMSLVYAVFAGFLMSACSHGILAIAMQLYKKGASIPAVITFLLASPWANLPITILMFGFFGWKAIFFVLAAMFIALLTGYIYMGLEKLGWIEQSKEVELKGKIEWTNVKNFDFKKSVSGVYRGMVGISNMVLWWIFIGIMVAALIGAYVPAHWFMKYLGPSFSGLLVTLFFATIIEVCSEGSSPIAFEIFSKVGTFGNPFVFLMAGVVTDYTEIGLIWSNIGKKAAIWLPIITVPLVLAFGWLFNAVL
ncbi:hypothetical protein GOV13_00165 [Candidatus Pacearchaeota archaeon]|nr:hypothetical protein [Candidatus Pacearchaeota archaeon]